ncbi:MAG: EamA family transporter [Pseudomonadota bacterium]|nr:EamA family transporter [Pseudomonadota bacterium]
MNRNWSNSTQCGIFVILSGCLISVQLALVRLIGDDVSVFEIVFFRALFGLVAISGLIAKDARTYLRPNRPGLTLLCGALAFLATVFFYLAATELPIADITAMHFTRPIFAAVLAALILREVIRGSRVVAIFAGLVGAAIIIRPGLIELNNGVFYVIGVVVIQSWNPINRKLLSRSENPDTVAIWNVLTVIPLAGVTSYFFWTVPTHGQLGWMALIGFLEVANQRVLSRAYMKGDALLVVALHYTRLPIAALLGFLILGEFPGIWVWIGGGVIAGAAIYLTIQETNIGGNRP